MTPARPRFNLIAQPGPARLAAFAHDVRAGLTSQPKHLNCCYFYDAEGSLLFEEICELPEYYLPQAEREILEARADELVRCFSGDVTLVELGSGNAAKTRLLIEAFLRRQKTLCYVPVDICRTILEESARDLLRDYPALDILAVAAEYHEGLRHLNQTAAHPRLILWLGSNVGNFDRTEAARFLDSVRRTMSAADRLLVGVDLRKERAVLEQAYDDAQGVTAEFNLNLLVRINRELGGHFDLTRFRHRAVYNESEGRIEMYVESVGNQRVSIDRLGLVVDFEAGEAIHTENSYKYSLTEIDSLIAAAGLRLDHQWLDRQQRFSVNLLAPVL